MVMLFVAAHQTNAESGVVFSGQPQVMEDGVFVSNRGATVEDKYDNPIYRHMHFGNRLRSTDDEFEDGPVILEFHEMNDMYVGYRLYENSGDYRNPFNQSDRFGICGGRVYNKDEQTGDYKRDSIGSPGNVISFLGMNNNAQFGEATNYSLYLDTAFINRGSGWIKPQYLIAVDQYKPEECGECNHETGDIESPNNTYVIARYLFNTSMYVKEVADSMLLDDNTWVMADKYYDKDKGEGIDVAGGGTESGYYYTKKNYNKVQPIKNKDILSSNGAAYAYDGNWERFAFSWAIHKGDSLYVLKGVGLEPMYKGMENDPHQVWLTLTREYGREGLYVDFSKLISENIVPSSAYKEAYYPLGDRSVYPEMRTYYDFKPATALSIGKTIGLHAIIALDDNTHKDWVFSFRYITGRGADDFVIESETTERNTAYSAMLRPGFGGWIKSQNGVPVISRCDEKYLMDQACVFNVLYTDNSVGNKPIGLGNESSKAVIIGGQRSVSIINAAGKNVVIYDMLSRRIVNVKASSDSEFVSAPSGIVVVYVEGEQAVKVVVK